MFPAAVWLLLIKDLKHLNNIARHRIYRHAGPTDLKRWPFLGGSPQPRHRRATSPYNLVNLANLVNLVNPAHLLLILFPGAWLGEGQARALRAMGRLRLAWRGTGPRPTGHGKVCRNQNVSAKMGSR